MFHFESPALSKSKLSGRREKTTGQKFHNISKFWNSITVIWNYHHKCIQISTNMPGIGSLIREMDVEIKKMWRK